MNKKMIEGLLYRNVMFGRYFINNSIDMDPIQWIVIKEDEKMLFMISKFAIDARQFSENPSPWDKSSLRKWLNNDFLNLAFTPQEQARIVSSKVIALPNAFSNASHGLNTVDKIFLLSCDEAEEYLKTPAKRKCVPTIFAKKKGVFTSYQRGTCWWWLRTPGYNDSSTCLVNIGGNVDCTGDFSDAIEIGVRPACRILKNRSIYGVNNN